MYLSEHSYSDPTLKKLFGLSGNLCAFPNCTKRMISENGNVFGQICHIEAAKPNEPRFNPAQTSQQRKSYENLILLCPNHHSETNDESVYTVEKLKQMKKDHEDKFKQNPFYVSDEQVSKITTQLLEQVEKIGNHVEKIPEIKSDTGQIIENTEEILKMIADKTTDPKHNLVTASQKNLQSFTELMPVLKKKIIQEYDDSVAHPLITGFKNLSGNHYVKQGYRHLRNKKTGENITDYVLNLIDNKMSQIQSRKNLHTKINTDEEKLEKIRLNDPILQRRKKLDNKTLKDVIKKLKIKSEQKTIDNIHSAQEIILKIEKWKKQIQNIEKENIIPIVGDYGSGKTSLCHKILYELCKIEDIFPLYVPLGRLPKHNDNQFHLLDDVFEFVKTEYGAKITQEEFVKYLENKKIVLILDALDEMSTKLDHQIAQENLNHVIKLSEKTVIVLTGRHTYFTDKMEQLFTHDELVKILDFNDEEVQTFLHRVLANNQVIIGQINKIIKERNIEEFARKPLFLSIIYKYHNELNKHPIINEAVILQTLTEEWIKHDVEKKNLEKEIEKKLTNERQRISEALAFAHYRTGRLISLEDVKLELEKELQYDIEGSLNRYENDAINSTFLVKEANDRFRFVVRAIVEYFVACRILDDIQKKKLDLIDDAAEIKTTTKETFNFIKGLVEIRWAVKPYVLNTFANENQIYEKLKEFENHSHNLFERIIQTRDDDSSKNVGNLLAILLKTGNLHDKPDLKKLELGGMVATNVDFRKANLSDAKMSNVDLSGADLSGADLTKARLFNATLIGANLAGANLSGANLANAKMSGCNISGANLDGARLIKTTARELIIIDEPSVKKIILVDDDEKILNQQKRKEMWQILDPKLKELIKKSNPRYK